jgi:hypothetical protein
MDQREATAGLVNLLWQGYHTLWCFSCDLGYVLLILNSPFYVILLYLVKQRLIVDLEHL